MPVQLPDVGVSLNKTALSKQMPQMETGRSTQSPIQGRVSIPIGRGSWCGEGIIRSCRIISITSTVLAVMLLMPPHYRSAQRYVAGLAEIETDSEDTPSRPPRRRRALPDKQTCKTAIYKAGGDLTLLVA